ncbi:MAG: hypothetical protein ACUVYA_00860 [Planctomycetota bacterium]
MIRRVPAVSAQGGLPRGGGLRLGYAGDVESAYGWLKSLGSFATGDGRGADVSRLDVIQVAYSDPTDGNVVFLLGTETAFNPDGVTVHIDGRALGTLDGLRADQLPGTNYVFIGAVAVGVNGYLDGALLGTLAGDATNATLGGLTVGAHTVNLEGDCGDGQVSARISGDFEVLAATLYAAP